MTQVLPATSAGKSFQLGMAMGKFHGVIRPTTPSGMRTLMANLFCSSLKGGFAEEAAAFAGDVEGFVDGFLHVAAGFGQHLAHFAGHVAGVLLFALLEENGRRGPGSRRAWARGRDARWQGFFGGGNGEVDVFGGGSGELADDVGVVGGIEIQEGFAAACREPFAADQVPALAFQHVFAIWPSIWARPTRWSSRRGKGIVVNEPSIVAINKNTGEVEAVGKEAKEMLGRTPGNIVAIKPMKDGVIADFKVTEKMLNYFIQKAHNRKMLVHPRIVIGVPSEITQVEKRAVMDSAYRAKASEVHLVEQAMVAAIGAGLPITEPGATWWSISAAARRTLR
jgi:hypothetical protein